MKSLKLKNSAYKIFKITLKSEADINRSVAKLMSFPEKVEKVEIYRGEDLDGLEESNPRITVHFENGTELELYGEDYLMYVNGNFLTLDNTHVEL